MVKGGTIAVYVLPVVFSIIFGSIVMLDILKEPDRELNLMRFGSFEGAIHTEQITIIGLESEYSISEPVQIQVVAEDLQFSCGDLYITIYTGDENAVTQSGFFNQCFDQDNPFLPIGESFSETLATPGGYEIVVDLLDQNQKNSITTSEKFTVK